MESLHNYSAACVQIKQLEFYRIQCPPVHTVEHSLHHHHSSGAKHQLTNACTAVLKALWYGQYMLLSMCMLRGMCWSILQGTLVTCHQNHHLNVENSTECRYSIFWQHNYTVTERPAYTILNYLWTQGKCANRHTHTHCIIPCCTYCIQGDWRLCCGYVFVKCSKDVINFSYLCLIFQVQRCIEVGYLFISAPTDKVVLARMHKTPYFWR